MRRQRGVSTIELIVLLAVTALMTFALARAFEAATTQERLIDASIEREQSHRAFEQTLRDVIGRAYLSLDPDETASYFLGGSVLIGGSGTNADSIVFTAVRPASEAVLASGLSFEEINERFGPPAGTEEIALSMTPYVGQGDTTGLFIRRQLPADGDPTQGGYEELLSSNVESIRFEFFDGQNWIGAWDTEAQPEPRLPAAVRVVYTHADDPGNERSITVRLRYSDITRLNPLMMGGATQ